MESLTKRNLKTSRLYVQNCKLCEELFKLFPLRNLAFFRKRNISKDNSIENNDTDFNVKFNVL